VKILEDRTNQKLPYQAWPKREGYAMVCEEWWGWIFI